MLKKDNIRISSPSQTSVVLSRKSFHSKKLLVCWYFGSTNITQPCTTHPCNLHAPSQKFSYYNLGFLCIENNVMHTSTVLEYTQRWAASGQFTKSTYVLDLPSYRHRHGIVFSSFILSNFYYHWCINKLQLNTEIQDLFLFFLLTIIRLSDFHIYMFQ